MDLDIWNCFGSGKNTILYLKQYGTHMWEELFAPATLLTPKGVDCHFSKRDNFCAFMLATLGDVALPKCYILLTLLHSERPKLYTILAFLSALGLKVCHDRLKFFPLKFESLVFFVGTYGYDSGSQAVSRMRVEHTNITQILRIHRQIRTHYKYKNSFISVL